MNKIIFTTVLLFFFKICISQNYLPYNEQLKDTLGRRVPSKTLTNSGKPLVIEFFGTHCIPCIDLLDSFKAVYPQWKQDFGVKIIVITTDKKSNRKKLIRMIKKHNWPFQFYFDSDKKLFNRLTSSNVVPQTIIFDGSCNIVGKFKGVKSNYGYKVVDGKVTDEIIKTNRNSKFGHIKCNLTDYENTFNFILKNKKTQD